jgi:hypothetical protein
MSHELVTAADEERAIQDRHDADLRRAKLEADDWKWLMNQPRGRRLVWRLLSRAGIYRSSFTGEALSSAFNEGERNLGLRINALLTEHCPASYGKMLVEQKDYE